MIEINAAVGTRVRVRHGCDAGSIGIHMTSVEGRAGVLSAEIRPSHSAFADVWGGYVATVRLDATGRHHSTQLNFTLAFLDYECADQPPNE